MPSKNEGSFRELITPAIDFLLLADRAEVVNGKLYVMGAAWERLTVQNFEAANLISIAVGILVPWNASNTQQTLGIDLLDADSNPLGLHVEGAFTTGRAPDAIPGGSTRVVMAFPVLPIMVKRPGIYSVVGSINRVEDKRTDFTVIAAPGAVAPGASA